MHWTDRRRAKAAIAEELARRGWSLYGYKPDRSDGMTDYYDPASWDGIAEKDGYVLVVDVGKSNNYVLSRSGGRRYTERVRDKDGERCGGTGQEPGAAQGAYEDAVANPKEFARWQLSLTGHLVTPVLGSAVNPHDFKDGWYKCRACHGAGHTWKEQGAIEPWPVFQPCPAGRLWHVERDGRVLASGVGLGPCADYDGKRARAAVEQLADRIDAALHTRSVVTRSAGVDDIGVTATIRHNQARNGIEVAFSHKPAEAVRGSLKALGFRWSQNQGLWYARFNTRTWERAHALLEDMLPSEGSGTVEAVSLPPAVEEAQEVEDPGETEEPIAATRYVIEDPLTGSIVGGNGADREAHRIPIPRPVEAKGDATFPADDPAQAPPRDVPAATEVVPATEAVRAEALETVAEPAGWIVLTAIKWKDGRPVAPRGIIEVRNGDGRVHRLTPFGAGLWCMSCSCQTCPAGDALLATKPTPKNWHGRAA